MSYAYAMKFRAPFGAKLDEESLEKLTPAYRRRVADSLAHMRRGVELPLSRTLFATTDCMFKFLERKPTGVLATKLEEAAARFAARNDGSTRHEKAVSAQGDAQFARRKAILPGESVTTASPPRPIFPVHVLYRRVSPFPKSNGADFDAYLNGVALWMSDWEEMTLFGRKHNAAMLNDIHVAQMRPASRVH